ncbi:UNVERIFIED_CONTAM: hypothetical protein Sradi_0158200 [Sesamum radiatum]|uniref:Uncharacterized protein n=1 Tax=Sesamum radiatum TaxID=300843 RepID=A0AAW2WKZ1_SESRA
MVDTTPNPNPGSGKQVTVGSSATQAVKPSTSLLEAEQRETSVEPYVQKMAHVPRVRRRLFQQERRISSLHPPLEAQVA